MIVLIGLIIIPAFNYIIKINQEISSERSELEKKMAMGLNAKKIKEEIDTAENSLSQVDKIFVKNGRELELITELESLAAKRNIDATIKSDFKTQAAGNGSQRMLLEINIAGNYPDLLAFTNDLDRLNYYYNIESINASKIKSKTKKIASINLIGQIYVK